MRRAMRPSPPLAAPAALLELRAHHQRARAARRAARRRRGGFGPALSGSSALMPPARWTARSASRKLGQRARRQPGGVLPFRRGRAGGRERPAIGSLQGAGAETLGHGVDRLDLGQRRAGRPRRRSARDAPSAACRHRVSILPETQRCAPTGSARSIQSGLPREEDEGQIAGRVMRWDAVGRAARAARPVPLDLDLDHDQAFRAAPRRDAGRMRRSNTPTGRWNSRSRMPRLLPAARRAAGRSAFATFGPTPGRLETGAKSGLRIVGRIGRVKVEARRPASPAKRADARASSSKVDRSGMAGQCRARLIADDRLAPNSSIILPTDGHGGCEYNALSFAQFMRRTGCGQAVTVAIPMRA